MGWSVTQQFGLTHHRPQHSFKGYTLVVPSGGDSVYLVDMQGRFVHRWSFVDFVPAKSELLANGNLLVMAVDKALKPGPRPELGDPPEPFQTRIRRLGANSSRLLEVTWEGEVVWDYENTAIHHDWKRLPNCNTIFPAWVEMPEELTKRVKGGARRRRERLPAQMPGGRPGRDRPGGARGAPGSRPGGCSTRAGTRSVRSRGGSSGRTSTASM